MNKSAITDSALKEYFENELHSYFYRTRQLHNDYWYIWSKSGLLDFACLELREKYKIPVLRYEDDCHAVELYGGDDSVTDEKHEFYDEWDNKETFKKELEELIKNLRLHRATFWFLFEKIFYGTPLDVEEHWAGYDTEHVMQPFYPLEEIPVFETLTSVEAKKVRSLMVERMKQKTGRKRLTGQENEAVDLWCNKLLRNNRTPKNKELTYLVIEQMKKYKLIGTGYDTTKGEWGEIKQTSFTCANNVLNKLEDPTIDFSEAAFRRMVSDLYVAFPILKDFIASQRKNC